MIVLVMIRRQPRADFRYSVVMYNKLITFKMKKVFYLIFLIAYTYCVNHIRLSTNSVKDKTLLPEESISSTLGLFKAVLKKSKCVLSVYNFNNRTNVYDYKGDYHSTTFTGDCNNLTIKQGLIVANNGSPYLAVTNIDYNHSTVFTIDDEGVMRLIGTFIQDNRVDIVSTETIITTFKTVNKYAKPFSQLTVAFSDQYAAIENERRWKFIAEFGQLTVYYGENPAIKFDHVYSSLTIRDSRIYDFDNQTLPGTLFTNITLEPRCADPKIYLEFKPPYVFVADPYWPIVTVYQQGGYKIITLALGKLPQYDYMQNITEINYNHFYSPCPMKTFEYRGDCVASCPFPYYHQIKGESGFCVLVCEEFAAINQTTRVCSCVTDYEIDKLSSAKLVRKCPSDAIQTPYGCRCTADGFYWDDVLTFSCVTKCPNRTVAKNQICMRCSSNCLTCQRDSFNRQFLECTSCKTGYNLWLGQCVASCAANYGKSFINNQCVACKDANCIDCSNDVNNCLRCGLLFTLFNGTCVDNCTGGYKNVYSQDFLSTCVSSSDQLCFTYLTSHYKGVPYSKCDDCMPGYFSHMSTCVQQCPSGYYAFNSYCACAGVANLTINDKCLNQVACPIGMSFDIRSHSCLSCPFGCISCINTQCTSCNPGYFLYVSPQSILCRRKSPLFPCNQQYSWQRNTTCMVTNYTDPNLAMTLCAPTISNCQVCVPHRNDVCIVCNVGYFIYNNTCIQQCPTPLIKYENTCILPEIVNCSVPHLLSIRKHAVITLKAMTASEAYKYYIYDNFEQANDPIGYMPYFQELTTHKSDGIPRQTSFFIPTWICLKCNDGYGLSNDFKQCLPCPTECSEQKCYMARPDSCLKKSGSCLPNEYIDKQTNACLQSCNSTSNYPEIIQGKLYCVIATTSATKDYIKIDGSIYPMSDGNYLTFFVFSDKLADGAPKVQVRSFTEKVSSNKKAKVGEELPATDAHSDSPHGVSAKIAAPIPLSQNSVSSSILNLSVINGEYIEVFNQSYNAYVLNLSQSVASYIGADAPIMFPNKVYGTVYLADHTAYITTWLAYIGYIMSIVIILLHAIFIGNQLIYKVDNLLIFVQTIHYFSYVQNLVGRLLSQFYFGWSFAHARFLPNLFSNIIPDHYFERKAPVPYKLINIDGNYFRNGGFSLAWVLIFIAAWIVIVFVIWGIIYKLKQKNEVWYPRVATQSLAAAFQFFSMNLVFFSVAQLAYGAGDYSEKQKEYFEKSQALAIITLVFVVAYTFIRFAFSFFGGLYMIKRIIIAIILVFSYNMRILILPLIILELVFMLMRQVLQSPTNKWQRISVYGESILFIGSYFLLYFCLDAGVNTIILSVFIFIFIVYLSYDLTTLYLESRNQFPQAELVKHYDELASETQKEKAYTMSNINGNRIQMNSRGGSLMQ